VITRVLVSAAIAVAAAMGVAAPASADPSPFNDLSCSCPPTVPEGGATVTDQLNKGIQTALTDLQGIQVPQ
jgi:hypothetical protein